MNHIDFTKTKVIDPDTGSYAVTRIPKDEQLCEICFGYAEYKITSEHDTAQQAYIYECQTCLIDEVTPKNYYSPTYYEVAS